MVTNIRPANDDDCSAIVRLIERVWPGEAPGSPHVRNVLMHDEHALLVAEQNGTVAGFASGFKTSAADGTCRWELDLLAVAPEHRGQGIAKALISACEGVARAAGASIIRTVVRADNRPMMAACRRCGLEQNSKVMRLFVCSSSPVSPTNNTLSVSAHPVLVHTLTYSGLWLEGTLSEDDLAAANQQRDEKGLDITGVLIAADNKRLLDVAQQANYQHIADFHFWTYRL